MMGNDPHWLPKLVLLEYADGNWDDYLELIYSYFKQDFIDSKPSFEGRVLGLKRYPLTKGKEATFWHFISEGDSEEDRLPDMRRCERILWPRPVIENCSDGDIKIWKNQRKGETRVCIWLESNDFFVVLAERKRYTLPWTAYLVTRNHQKKKMQKEYERYWQDRGIKS